MKIKEGGVMDIHELRQFESVYKPSKEVAFCWLRKQYVQLSTEENHTEIVDHANDSLRIWQAAKAQAVPDLGELQERIAGHQYYHDERGHIIVDMDDVVKEISGFDSWKAQAVPEGFVLVKVSDIAKLAIAVSRVDLMTYSEERPDSEKLAWQNVANKLEAMIELQEPAND